MRRVTHRTRHVTHQCFVSHINTGILRQLLKREERVKKGGGESARTLDDCEWRMASGWALAQLELSGAS